MSTYLSIYPSIGGAARWRPHTHSVDHTLVPTLRAARGRARGGGHARRNSTLPTLCFPLTVYATYPYVVHGHEEVAMDDETVVIDVAFKQFLVMPEWMEVYICIFIYACTSRDARVDGGARDQLPCYHPMHPTRAHALLLTLTPSLPPSPTGAALRRVPHSRPLRFAT
eukprot:scaffold56764_cov57-Phaeocystis_antarctica.AAC.2